MGDLAQKPADLDSVLARMTGQVTTEPVTAVARLSGGSKKGVYRLTLGDGQHSMVAYVWHPSENYWPSGGRPEDPADLFSDASGADLFIEAHRLLTSLGVRVPELLHFDDTRSVTDADVALVEDLSAQPHLGDFWRTRPKESRDVLERLALDLGRMHGQRSPVFGKITRLPEANSTTAMAVATARAVSDLREGAAHLDQLRAVQSRLEDRLRELNEAIRARSDGYALIHGELGPDHVRVDRSGSPVLIDIEGLMYFDLEWEHAFVGFRFGEHYQPLDRPDLDISRLELYRLCLYLSLCAGPLRLLDGDFPHREAMLSIVEANLQRALAVLRSAD